MGEHISRRDSFKRLAVLGLVAGGYGSTPGTAHASSKPVSEHGNEEHAVYHRAREIFPVVMGTIDVAEVQQQ